MTNETTPYGNVDSNAGTGTAPARGVESMELGDYVPKAEDPIDIDKRLTRWLFFAGDLISPRQKRERKDLAIGGEYLGQQYQTLGRSKGLLRRCQMTPMEIGYDFINSEILGENTTNLVVSQVVSSGDDARGAHRLGAKALNAVPVYPGDEIKGLIHRENNATSGVKGFVELEGLVGMEYADVRQLKIQEFLFPNWNEIINGFAPFAFNRIAALRAHFESRAKATSEGLLHHVIEDCVKSCDAYRRWGIDYLKMSAQLVKVPMNAGFAHTYSDQAEMLFEQLEMTREDAIRAVANMPAPASNDGMTNADVKDLMHQMVQLQTQIVALQAGQQIPAPVTPVIPEAPVAEEAVKPQAAPTANHVDTPKTVVEQTPGPDGLIALTEEGKPRCTALNATTGKQCSQPSVEGTDRCAHPAHTR